MSSITASDLTQDELNELVMHGLTINIVYMWYWSKRIEVGRILFFLVTYLPKTGLRYADHSTESLWSPIGVHTHCDRFPGNIMPYPTEDFNLASLAVVQLCLMLRTWALFGARRNVLIGLSVFMIACAFASGVIIALTGGGSALFDFVLCILSIIKVLEHRRDDVHSPLVDLLHRDGLAYFALSLTDIFTGLAPDVAKRSFHGGNATADIVRSVTASGKFQFNNNGQHRIRAERGAFISNESCVKDHMLRRGGHKDSEQEVKVQLEDMWGPRSAHRIRKAR
ncbi:hypothetical protein CALCODRAFT_509357 [Calocera cornea HHB12733]|uniref:Uncharacterized protein n=1 Tax=Calocera cornea HHB12733 TaxID=1353952 RepID=A0A165FD73_9BASI|nr:hypothetical protein CALCODRAFT_509357 [Calocera cornea HHB12733]